MQPRIASRTTVHATPYFRLLAKALEGSNGDPFYCLDMPDYVTVLAVTAAGEVPLVRQYRPAVEAYSLELPSGHIDPGETPEAAAHRELLEETGYEAGALELLGCLKPDTGRHANRLWCYFAAGVRRVEGSHEGEAGVELVLCRPGEWRRLLSPPLFDHALHLAVLQLALAQGKLSLQQLLA